MSTITGLYISYINYLFLSKYAQDIIAMWKLEIPFRVWCYIQESDSSIIICILTKSTAYQTWLFLLQTKNYGKCQKFYPDYSVSWLCTIKNHVLTKMAYSNQWRTNHSHLFCMIILKVSSHQCFSWEKIYDSVNQELRSCNSKWDDDPVDLRYI